MGERYAGFARGLVRAAGLAAIGIMALAAGSDAQAQAGWPDRQLRLVVPFAPGGASDILGRLIAKELAERLRQPVIVENKPGAGGTIGADFVAKSPADGYTLLLADSSVVMTFPHLYAKLPYQAKDLVPVSNIATFGLILIAPANSRIGSIGDILASEKANPGKLNMASPGSGSSNHLTLEKFNAAAGTKITHVPYKGAGPAVNAVVAGEVDLTLASGAASKPLLDGGKVKAIAVTSAKRNPLLPDVPTIAESKLPGFESTAGQGVFVPAGTPPEIVRRLHAEIRAILRGQEAQDRWLKMGIDRPDQTPEEFAAWLSRESDNWSKLIREANIKIE